MTAYSLFELNEYINQVLVLNFSNPLWITAEIGQLDVSKGHCYISLVQKEEATNTIIAHSQAVIWASTYTKLKRKLGRTFQQILQEGMEIKVQARIDFHERFGLKLLIEDIDLTHTLGKFALQRQKAIEELQALDLLHKNRQIPLPIVLQRIAVISSQNAAGLQDYFAQLQHNPYGYNFNNALFPAAVQGAQVEKDILRQLKKIALRKDEFDCVVIIRGGGSRLDLAAFDQVELCKVAAEFELPILVGIGHETDESLIDLVAHQSLKTPTAVAEFLISRNTQFEGHLQLLFIKLQQLSKHKVLEAKNLIQQTEQFLTLKSKEYLQKEEQRLDFLKKNLTTASQQSIEQTSLKLKYIEQAYQLLSPEAILKRGFSLVYQNGKPIQNRASLKKGAKIENRFHDGNIESEII